MTALFSILVSLLWPAPAQTPAPPEMMTYQMVFLRMSAKTDAPADVAKMQQDHLANLLALNKKRVNLLFGPFLDTGDLRGICIVDAPDAAAATKMFADDPYVRSGYMTADAEGWIGPSGWFNPPNEPPTPEPFILVFLRRGPKMSPSLREAQEIQNAHTAYLDGLHAKGAVAVTGPFRNEAAMRELVILRVSSVDDARQLMAGDPAIKGGRLVVEDARPWMTFKGILK